MDQIKEQKKAQKIPNIASPCWDSGTQDGINASSGRMT